MDVPLDYVLLLQSNKDTLVTDGTALSWGLLHLLPCCHTWVSAGTYKVLTKV